MSYQDIEDAAHSAFASPTKLASKFTSPPKSPTSHSLSPTRTSRPSLNPNGTTSDTFRSSPSDARPSPGLSKADLAAAIQKADSALAGLDAPVLEHIMSSTCVLVAKDKSDGGNTTKAASTTTAPSVHKNASHQSAVLSISSGSRKDMDLKQNDNAFHVVANLVLDKFQAKMTPGDTFLTLDASDIAELDQMVPPTVRISFVAALRYRLEHNCPPNSDLNIHALTRECGDLGLDRQGNSNPLLATLNAAGTKAITIAIPPLSKNKTGFSTFSEGQGLPPFQNTSESTSLARSSPTRPALPRTYPERHSATVPMAVPPTPGDASVGGSTITGGSISEAHVSTTESLARQQLMAELREASNLMAESVTPEAATFWRNHVVDLQARLRALHGEGVEEGPSAAADANRQLLEQYDKKPAAYHIEPAPEPRFIESNYETPYSNPSSYQQQAQAQSYQDNYKPPREQTVVPSPAPSPPKRNLSSTLDRNDNQSSDHGRPVVVVIAPADLPGGYHFEAEIQGRRFLATVPEGGVQKGDTFSCVMQDLETVGVGVPVGRWRDRLCDCGAHGICHALFLTTLFCPLLALSQVMTRLNYDFLGRPTNGKPVRTAWSTMWSILIFLAAMNGLIYTAYYYKWHQKTPLSAADYAAVIVLNAYALIYAIYATASTRASLREKYMIREHRFFDLEDCCCATFCMPCTICQMARHTVQYDVIDAACCKSTGWRYRESHYMEPQSSGYMI